MAAPSRTARSAKTPNRAARKHPEVEQAYVGIPEAATYLGVDHKTIRRLITSGKLPAFRLGNRVLKVRITDLEAVLTPIGGAV